MATQLEPHAAYVAARVVVERREQLPPWLLDSWENGAEDDQPDADD